jgi:hypothetical protein
MNTYITKGISSLNPNGIMIVEDLRKDATEK